MVNETLGASAAKTAAINAGAALSMATGTGLVGNIAGVLAVTYSVIQIVKALPWLTDYFVALRSGFGGDWSHWRSIARRSEKSNDDNAK